MRDSCNAPEIGGRNRDMRNTSIISILIGLMAVSSSVMNLSDIERNKWHNLLTFTQPIRVPMAVLIAWSVRTKVFRLTSGIVNPWKRILLCSWSTFRSNRCPEAFFGWIVTQHEGHSMYEIGLRTPYLLQKSLKWMNNALQDFRPVFYYKAGNLRVCDFSKS